MSLGLDNVESLVYLPDQNIMKRMVKKTRQKAINPPPDPQVRDSFEISEDYSHIKIKKGETEEEITAFLAHDSAVEDGVMVGDKERYLIH